jgi:hypothetical protein
MVRLQHKIQHGIELLQYFTTRRWNFKSAKFCALREKMSPADREIFYTDFEAIDDDEYMVTTVLGARQYCLKEPLTSLPRCRRNLKMYVASSQPEPYTQRTQYKNQWILSIVRNSKYKKTERFGNWMYFRPQVRGVFCWVP